MTAELKAIKPMPKTVKITFDDLSIPLVVEVWRVLERMQKEDPKFFSGIPTINHLYEFMAQNPSLAGLAFKKGRKVVGVLLGQVVMLPAPVYFVAAEYIDPEFRAPELMEAAKVRMKEKLLRAGITHVARIGGKI